MILKNGRILEGDCLVEADVRIENGKIAEIGKGLSGSSEIDVEGCWIIGGAVDVHAHLREPGYEYKGDIETETRSAAKGGITSIMAMPNTNPVPCDAKSAKLVYDLVQERSLIHTYIYGSVTKDQAGKKVADVEGMLPYVKALSDDGVCVNNLRVLKKAMIKAKKHGLVIASHAEAKEFPEPAAEYEAVRREIKLAEETGCEYHFCHLSVEQSFIAVRVARFKSDKITCEVTPHHLVLCEDYVGQNPNFKMNPPLRSLRDMKFANRALAERIPTMIATDHAPHSKEDKSKPFDKAPNGIIGFETFLPIVYTNFVRTGKLTHKQMLELVTVNPAKRFNLPYTEIAVGQNADIAVLDIDNSRRYEESEILSKSSNSPYIGMEFFGFNKLTLVDGNIVYNAFA